MRFWKNSLSVQFFLTTTSAFFKSTLIHFTQETSVPSTTSGVVKRVLVNVGDKVDGDDLLVEIE